MLATVPPRGPSYLQGSMVRRLWRVPGKSRDRCVGLTAVIGRGGNLEVASRELAARAGLDVAFERDGSGWG